VHVISAVIFLVLGLLAIFAPATDPVGVMAGALLVYLPNAPICHSLRALYKFS
jgi:hypothetical protein